MGKTQNKTTAKTFAKLGTVAHASIPDAQEPEANLSNTTIVSQNTEQNKHDFLLTKYNAQTDCDEEGMGTQAPLL